MATVSNVTLNDDGICEDFFNLLWIRDELNFGPAINIPDTVVFKYGQPTHWYFTATDGRIKRKNRQNLINARIEEAFSKYILGYDVVATFISLTSEINPETGKSQPSTVQFLDKAALNEFLYSTKKDCSGILQRFIDPKSNKNEMIRGIWSPKICLLERTENIHFLHDLRFGLYERCVTCEGPDYYSISTPLRGPVLAGQIQKICESVVSHVSEVTYNQKKITRIVINFKVDSRDKIWLLYTTSIRCDDDTVIIPSLLESESQKIKRKLLNINSVLTLPASVNLNPYKSYGQIQPRTKVRCISCGNETLDNMRHPVTYKSVLKHFEHLLHIVKNIARGAGKNRFDRKVTWPPDPELIDAAGGVGFGCLELISDVDDINNAKKGLNNNVFESDQFVIPPIIRYLHPKLNGASYNRCKMDPLFLHKTVSVCEPCYLVYAEFATMMLRLGSDLSKILTAESAGVTVHDLPTTAKQRQMNEQLNRPSSAEWRQMSTLNKSRSMSAVSSPSSMSRNHIKAKESAIGLRSSDSHVQQPDFPVLIRNNEDTLSYQFPSATSPKDATYMNTLYNANASVDSIDSFRTNPALATMNINASIGGGADRALGNQNVNPMEVNDVIAERERRFFKEIARNPQLRDQHPLMHLISAQQKLAVADQLSGVFDTKQSNAKEGLFKSSSYGRQTNDKHDHLGPYRVVQPYVSNGVVTVPQFLTKGLPHSTAKKTRSPERTKSVGSLLTDDEEQFNANNNSAANTNKQSTVKSKNSKLSKQERKHAEELSKHQQFLMNTLNQVAGEVMKTDPSNPAAPSPYEQPSIPPSSDPKKSSKSTKSKASSGSTSTDTKSKPVEIIFAESAEPLALGGVAFNEGDNESTESSILRNLGVVGGSAANDAVATTSNFADDANSVNSLAEGSQDDAFSFSKSLTSDQKLEEYGIGAADSLRNAISGSGSVAILDDDGIAAADGIDDNDSLRSGSTVSMHSSIAIKDLVEAISADV